MCGKHKCLKEDECIKKMEYTHIMKYYLTWKLNAILIEAIKWMNHESICWSKLSQRPNKNCCMIRLLWKIYNVCVCFFSLERKNHGYQEEKTELLFLGEKFQFGIMTMFWKWIVLWLHKNVTMYNITELYSWKW